MRRLARSNSALADLGFDLLDLQRHRRRREVQDFGGPQHAALARDLDEDAQLPEGDVHGLALAKVKSLEILTFTLLLGLLTVLTSHTPRRVQLPGDCMNKPIEAGRHRRQRDHRQEAALQRRRPEVPADGLLGRRLRAQGHRHAVPVPHHAAGRRGPDRGRRRSGRRVEHRHLDGGVDRPPDGLRQLPRQGLQGRAGAGHPGPVFRLGGLRHHPVRGRLDRQHHGQPDRQRLQLQAAEGGAAGGHPHAGGAGQDLQGPATAAWWSSASAWTSSAARCWAPPPSPSWACRAATTAASSTKA